MQAIAISFNEWVINNAALLKHRLSLYTALDEDAFQDAYLTLATTCRSKEESILFEKIFTETYRQLYQKNLNESYTTVHPDDLFFSLISSEEAESDDTQEATYSKNLILKIQHHIRTTFSTREVTAWNMKLEGYSLRDITDVVDMGTTKIYKTVRKIASETRAQFSYAL